MRRGPGGVRLMRADRKNSEGLRKLTKWCRQLQDRRQTLAVPCSTPTEQLQQCNIIAVQKCTVQYGCGTTTYLRLGEGVLDLDPVVLLHLVKQAVRLRVQAAGVQAVHTGSRGQREGGRKACRLGTRGQVDEVRCAGQRSHKLPAPVARSKRSCTPAVANSAHNLPPPTAHPHT